MLRGVPFDALVVLGCRVDGGELSHAARRRVERAALAYAELGAELVIASGGKSWQGQRECEVFARGLVERGVPAERVLQETDSLTTRGNAVGTARLLRGRPHARLGIVTCDWHMARALSLFRRLGLSVSPVPAASPRGPWRAALSRSLRERCALALDLVVTPLWLRS
ncbi:MAG: YdcF family protein [Myxococcales bacterium]|nr:MAG: YdcF family protein [Myxococcales bacterium]